MYNADQWKVMGILAADLPKRAVVRTKQVVAHFRRRENADRIVRNSYRKLRENGHIEIVERGEYRLTPAGVKFYNKMSKEGFKPSAKRAVEASKPVKKKTAKKTAAKPKTAKKSAKKAKAKKKVKASTLDRKKATTKKSKTAKKTATKAKPAAKKAKAKKKGKKAASNISALMKKAAESKPKAKPADTKNADKAETKSANGNGVAQESPKEAPATPLRW